MKPSHKLARRSFLVSVVGGAAAIGLASDARAQTYTGTTDCDSGNGHDRPGYGTGVRNQYTDSDTGPQGDPRCRGRGPGARSPGAPSGTGRYGGSASGCSDTDRSPNADPGGRGVRCNGQIPPTRYPPTNERHCTDSDRGNNADLPGQGRHC